MSIKAFEIGVIIFFLVLLTGCASSSPLTTDYDAEDGLTSYKTRSISLTGLNIGSGYGSGAHLQLRALASCFGQDCTPKEVVLVFQVSGSSDLRMEDRSVRITADGEQFRSARQQREINQYFSDIEQATGNVASLHLTFDEFQRLAEAENLSGSLGSSSFSLSYESRSPFRALIQHVQESSVPS